MTTREDIPDRFNDRLEADSVQAEQTRLAIIDYLTGTPPWRSRPEIAAHLDVDPETAKAHLEALEGQQIVNSQPVSDAPNATDEWWLNWPETDYPKPPDLLTEQDMARQNSVVDLRDVLSLEMPADALRSFGVVVLLHGTAVVMVAAVVNELGILFSTADANRALRFGSEIVRYGLIVLGGSLFVEFLRETVGKLR